MTEHEDAIERAREWAREQADDNTASTLERMMPRDWLTPDLRMQVAQWIVEEVREEPWALGNWTKSVIEP